MLNTTVPNPFISQEFAKTRLNCGQRCKESNRKVCGACDTQLILANKILDYSNRII